ncbi:MAG: type IX secretion system sortase PorU [Salinivirgaceae bacterium]
MRFILLIISALFLTFQAFTQNQLSVSGSVDWNEIANQMNSGQISKNDFPKHNGQIGIPGTISTVNANFVSAKYIPISDSLAKKLELSQISETISIQAMVLYERKNPLVEYSFIPFRKNSETGSIEQITDFVIDIQYNTNTLKKALNSKYINSSVLNSGKWYKIKVDTTGVFKLTYEQLVNIGFSNPGNIKIYSHGGQQLPYMNNEPNYDDLVEMPISMSLGNDATFNGGDYILFYTQGPVTWSYNSNLHLFINRLHNYSNYTYLFLTEGLGNGKRVPNQEILAAAPTKTSNSYDSYRYHEKEKFNLIRSGRTWYGEKFKPGESLTFSFDISQIIVTEPVKIYTDVAGRREPSSPISYFNIYSQDNLLSRIEIADTYGQYVYGHNYSRKMELTTTQNPIKLRYDFAGGNSISEGYINFICLNAREKIKYLGSPLLFRDVKSVGPGNITEFLVDYTGSDLIIWDVTAPLSPIQMNATSVNQNIRFLANTSNLSEYVAFKPTDALKPILDGEDLGFIENQNLHELSAQDMVIVTNPKFAKYAEDLAQFHRTNDSLQVFVTTPDKIFNEFSSGTPDVAALRNFLRMLYDRASSETELPKYLLLFGDGSYDNKTVSSSNSNYLLTYQSINSLSETSSFVSDDFFGLLDETEGEHFGKLDLGIGRFPVQTEEEAQLMLDKIYAYLSPESMGDWRTKICFIGDDGDGGTHMRQPDDISKSINIKNPEYNIAKIYLDAYPQISTPAGQRFPDVTKAINDMVIQGALIIDYVGHGNPRILTHEEVLSTSDVRSWTNKNKLSIFVTASCEVGRFDDYSRTSLGEWMLLNPDGGGIAALTTTRLVYSGSNDVLNTNFFNTVFNTDLRLGDVIRIAKVNTPGDTNKRNFTLLGDPALKLAIPESKNYVSSIKDSTTTALKNNTPSVQFESDIIVTIDTLNALSKAKVTGYLIDKNDNYLDKDGILTVSVFDKADTLFTYGQDNGKIMFSLQDKLLYKGQASITAGHFEFDFIVPKDINFKYGKGKISLYAKLDSIDALGYSDQLIIGGNAKSEVNDQNEPIIQLFLNDTLFVNGGITDQNPILLAKLSDEYGINTTGNGFGHNITALIDDDQDNTLVLNNYYQGDMDKYNCGEVIYPLKGLSEGYHTLYLKAWDIMNNSSDASIGFYVTNNQEAVIEDLTNYPNPFKESTQFIFNHNQAYPALKVTIDIYDLMGNKAAQIIQKNPNEGFQIEPITWYGTSNNGSKLANGIYIYKATINTIDGVKTSKSSKLMIFR